MEKVSDMKTQKCKGNPFKLLLYCYCLLSICTDSLKSLIQARQKAQASVMDNLLDSLADKYGPKKKKGKSSKNKK